MEKYEKINDGIYRLEIPFKDIYTTVYTVHTPEGVVLFDTATFDEDVENYIIPFLKELKVTKDMLKYIFISHKHGDHAGGLKKLLETYPDVCILSRSSKLKEEYAGFNVVALEDGDVFLNVLKLVTIPGHTKDSSGVLDTRTKTLISGDSLQLYGIYGSGKWGANIRLIGEHINAVDKLRSMDIDTILTAHDYHPCGHMYSGKKEVLYALDMCVEPLYKIKDLITENSGADDEKICNIYNNTDKLPTLGVHVVTAVREYFSGDYYETK